MFKKKDVIVTLLEIFLIIFGLIGLTLGVKYIMNSINVNVDTSKLAIDNMNANVTNGTLTPIEDSTVNINTTNNVLRITFDVKGASTNTGNNIIYDVILNLDAECSLKNKNIKWNLYKNSKLLTSGNLSPEFDGDVLSNKLTLTDTQQDLVKYDNDADKYVFILWMSESCNEEDITKCDLSEALSSDIGGKTISGNIDIRLLSGKKKNNERKSISSDYGCSATEYISKLADISNSHVYKLHHDAISASSSVTGSEISASDDFRYQGSKYDEINNLICLDKEGNSTCPDENLVTIIGSIYEELSGKNRIKVLTVLTTDYNSSECDFIRAFSWDYKVINGKVSYNTVWATPTNGNYSDSLDNGSSIMKLLNNEWLYGKTGIYYNRSVNPVNVCFRKTGLNDTERKYVDKSRYYLGGGVGSSTPNLYYEMERTNKVNNGGATYWDGYIGLLYPSDYGYTGGLDCIDNDFMRLNNDNDNSKCINNGLSTNQYLFLNATDNSTILGFEGEITECDPYWKGDIILTFYLTPDVYITGGDGSYENPYTISRQ